MEKTSIMFLNNLAIGWHLLGDSGDYLMYLRRANHNDIICCTLL